jgi:hypothetical protein
MHISQVKHPFNYQLGKLYRYNGKEEKVFSFSVNQAPYIASISNGDIVIFLRAPSIEGIQTKAFYCKILSHNGIIGEIFWDEKTFDAFTLFGNTTKIKHNFCLQS